MTKKKSLILTVLFFAIISCNKETYQPEVLKNSKSTKIIDNTHKEKVVLKSGIVLTKEDSSFYLQGDIRLTKEQIEILDVPLTKSAMTINFINYWPNGIVYYSFSPLFPQEYRGNVNGAIADYEASTSIRFVESTTAPNRVEFVYTVNNTSSDIGMIGGTQITHLAQNFGVSTVVHEIGHIIGLLHEHARNDRGNYVIINYDNIDPDDFFQFDILPFTFDHGDFDLSSVMLYDWNQLAIDSTVNTIWDKNNTARKWYCNYPLTQGDIDCIEFIYGGPYKKIETVQDSDHPNAYYYCDSFSDEWANYYDNTIVFYSDQNMTNEVTLSKPRLINYTYVIYENTGNGGMYMQYDSQVTVPAGVSRYIIGGTWNEYRAYMGYTQYEYQSSIVVH